jgi:hypothetical protein
MIALSTIKSTSAKIFFGFVAKNLNIEVKLCYEANI